MRLLIFFGAAIVTGALAGAPSAAPAGEAAAQTAPAPAEITIDKFAFAPAVLTVKAGTTVTWKNADHTPHTVAEKNKAFRSAALDTGDTFSFTFAKPGEYGYGCTLHPQMTGKVVVTP